MSDITDIGLEILDETTCIHLVRQAAVGRIAIVRRGVAVVVPVNFVAVGSDLFFFTAPGMKLDAVTDRMPVTFQADEIDTARRLGWSVLAVGVPHLASGVERTRVEALGLAPWAVGDRHELVRLRPTFWSGRRIVP